MKTKQRNLALVLCSFIMAIALVFGVATFNTTAYATDTGVSVTMESGARIRLDTENPGLIFTADIANFDADLEYGMILVENAVLTDNGITADYISALDTAEASYQKIVCTPYGDADKKITAHFDVATEELSTEYAAIAYVKSGDEITYSALSADHVRSVEYVAQKSYLWGDGDQTVLDSFIAPQINAEYGINSDLPAKDAVLTNDNTYITIVPDLLNQADADVDPVGTDGSRTLSFMSKKAYEAGSTITMDIFVPVEYGRLNEHGNRTNWVAINWSTSRTEGLGLYAFVDGNGTAIGDSLTAGAWTTVSVTLPSDNPEAKYYFWISADKGAWHTEDGTRYALSVDNVVIDQPNAEDESEDFERGVATSIFAVKGNADKDIDASDVVYDVWQSGKITMGAPAAEQALKYTFNVSSEEVAFITKDAYAGGSTVSFRYYIPEGTPTSWWGMAWSTTQSGNSIYAAASASTAHKLPENVVGSWVDVRYELPAGGPYYLYLGSEVSATNWKIDGVDSYVLIDDLSITTNGVTVTDNFNMGVDAKLIKVLKEEAVSVGEGYVEPVIDGERAAKYIFNVNGETVSFITKDAYASGSTISFKYYIPEGTTTSWWRVAFDTVKDMDYYDTQYVDLSKATGAWTDFSYTLPAGGPYYLAITSECGGAHGRWMLNGENSYALIDNFTVTNGDTVVTEDFNKKLEDSIFDVTFPGGVVISEKGEGYVDVPLNGDYAMKYNLNKGADSISHISKEAYAGGSTVSFRYYIPTGMTTQWWGLAYSATTDGIDIYDAADASKAHQPGKVTGEWTTAEFTLPAGGPYYLYFGMECGHWAMADESAPYMLIDDFTVNGEVETFSSGVETSIFTVINPEVISNSADGEGYAPLTGEFAVKVILSKISSTASTPTFITKTAYTLAEETAVTFDYYTNSECWMMFGWTTDQRVADIYAHVGSNANNYGSNVPNNVKDEWTTMTVTVPAGTWYFYFAGNKPDCNSNKAGCGSDCYIIVDNFKVGDIVTENFNHEVSESIFAVSPFSSHHAAISLVDGKIAPVEFEPGEHSAKIMLDKIVEVGVNGNATFITKDSYDMGTTISFKYFVSEEGFKDDNWISLSIFDPNYAPDANLYDDTVAYLPITVGEWLEFTYTIETIYTGDEAWPGYFYFGSNVTNWGDVGYMLIDDVTITAPDGTTVTETFNDGFEESIFAINTPSAVSYGEGFGAEQTPDVDPDEPNDEPNDEPEIIVPEVTFDGLLAEGKLHEYVNSEDRVHVLYDLDVDATGIAQGSLALNVKFDYLSTGRAFAIVLDETTFIYVDGETLTVYQGGVAVKEVAIANGKVDLAIRADGTMLLGVDGGDYTVIGSVQIGDVKFVSLFGEGVVEIFNLAITTYERVPA